MSVCVCVCVCACVYVGGTYVASLGTPGMFEDSSLEDKLNLSREWARGDQGQHS